MFLPFVLNTQLASLRSGGADKATWGQKSAEAEGPNEQHRKRLKSTQLRTGTKRNSNRSNASDNNRSPRVLNLSKPHQEISPTVKN
jgi:hypothetical protein